MDVVHERAVGIDISKKDAKVCLRVPGKRRGTYSSTVSTWGSTTAQVLALQQFLLEAQVTTIVMESTSDYWKPFYYVFEDTLPVVLVNAKAARNIPGRKTDVLTELPGPSTMNRRRRRFSSARFCFYEQRREPPAGTVRVGGAAGRCTEGQRQSLRTILAG